LTAAGDAGRAAAQFAGAGNMTDQIAALAALAETDTPARTEALAAFYGQWRGEELVLDKWFAIQAVSSLPGTVEAVRGLMRHGDFDLRNPNRVRSLVGAFSASNQVRFHDASGAGYRLLGDVLIALDPMNGQTAARMLNPLCSWRRHDAGRAALMRAELERLLAQPGVSRFSYEKASKSLNG
jgi:aminopeptidase N